MDLRCRIIGFIVWMHLSAVLLQGATVLRVADDTGQVVPSKVFIEESQGNRVKLGETDAHGLFILGQEYLTSLKAVIVPVGAEHLPNELHCSKLRPDSTNTVLLTRTEFMENLLANAALLHERERYEDAALVYNEIYQRARVPRPGIAKAAQAEVYKDFALYLGVEGELLTNDMAQGRFVMTENFEGAVRAYQKERGIEQTGVIDFKTLLQASKHRVFEYLTRRWTAEELADENFGAWRLVISFDVTRHDQRIQADLGDGTVVVAEHVPPVGWDIGVYALPLRDNSQNLLSGDEDWRGPQPWQSFAMSKTKKIFPDTRIIEYGHGGRKLKITLIDCKTVKEGDSVRFARGRIDVHAQP